MLGIALLHLKYGFTARYFGQLGNFIVGIIREQCIVCIFSACAQATVTGNKHPVVGVADNAHKKWAKGIAVRYFQITVGAYLSIVKFHVLINVFALQTLASSTSMVSRNGVLAKFGANIGIYHELAKHRR
jgi:hypothetical protein